MSQQANSADFSLSDEDWMSLGKADAWEGKPKRPPQEDSQAASMYELGYAEGVTQRPPLEEDNPSLSQ